MSDQLQDPKETVRRGYDAISHRYRDDDGTGAEGYREFLHIVIDRLPSGSAVLDLGCGNGVPGARVLADHFQVTGVDISDVQIERAQQLVPAARFVRADMTAIDFPSASFEGVVSLYAIIHVPLVEQRPLFQRMYRWLRPGGLLVAILGSQAWTGTEPQWLGGNADMYWSHADAATYQAWLQEIGFAVESTRFIPEGTGGHTLFVAIRDAVRR